MTLVNSPDASIVEITALISRDSVIAAAVLRRANNWMISGRVVTDLRAAILRLGLTECANLICTLGMRSLYSHLPPAVQIRCEALQKHCLFVATLASTVSQSLALGCDRTVFVAGLLHDIGRLIVCVKAPGEAPDADPIDFAEDDNVLQRERDHLGVDHCAIGYQFATANTLPEGVIRTTLNHHRPDQEHLQRDLVALIATADQVANHAQREHKIHGFSLSNCAPYRVLSREWEPHQKAAFRNQLPNFVVGSIKQTRAMLKLLA